MGLTRRRREFSTRCVAECVIVVCSVLSLQPRQRFKERTFEGEGFTRFKKLKYDAAQATFVSDNTSRPVLRERCTRDALKVGLHRLFLFFGEAERIDALLAAQSSS